MFSFRLCFHHSSPFFPLISPSFYFFPNSRHPFLFEFCFIIILSYMNKWFTNHSSSYWLYKALIFLIRLYHWVGLSLISLSHLAWTLCLLPKLWVFQAPPREAYCYTWRAYHWTDLAAVSTVPIHQQSFFFSPFLNCVLNKYVKILSLFQRIHRIAFFYGLEKHPARIKSFL